MDFRITSSWLCLDTETDKLIATYPCLNKYELRIVDLGRTDYWKNPQKHAHITINSLEELLELQTAVEHPLIITQDEIEIYDDYRE